MKQLKWHRLRGALLIVLMVAVSLPTAPVLSQGSLTFTLDQVDGANYPNMSLMATVFDERGYVLPNLAGANFSIVEDGAPVIGATVEALYEHPLTVLVALDTSNSMNYGAAPSPLASLQGGLKDFAQALPAQDAVGLLTFDAAVHTTYLPGVDRTPLSSALDNLTTHSGTRLNDALIQAADTLTAGGAARSTLIVIADSRDAGESRQSIDQAVEVVRATRAVVHVIAWGTAKMPQLEQLADLTHGLYQELPAAPYPSEGDLQAALANVQKALDLQRLQYTLTYDSGLPCDGGEHTIQVRVEHLGRAAEATGQVATPECAIQVSLPDLSDGQEVGGKVLIAPRFNRPETIDSVEFLIDDAPLDKVASAPFEYTWDSSTLPAGEHTLSLMARDRDGNTNRMDVRLMVKPPLTVTLKSPLDGAALAGPTVLQAEVISTTKIARVIFLVDGKAIGERTEPPFELQWNPVTLADGAHEVMVEAEDVSGYRHTDQARFSLSTGQATGRLGGIGLAAVLVILAGGIGLGVPLARRMRRRQTAGRPSDALGSLAEAGGGMPPLPPTMRVAAAAEACLNELAGANPGQSWRLPQEGEIRLGRKRDENDIPLQGATASRRHAVVRVQNGAHVIYSLKTDNLVQVNGAPVTQHLLRPGDHVRLGDSEFEYSRAA